MYPLSGYRVLTQLYESANSLVYRSLREQDNQPVILKVLKQDYPTSGELTRYRQEYDITRSLNQEGVIKAYGLEPYQNTLVMFLEDFGGQSLATLKQQHPSTLEDFLEIAIKITTVLGEIHAANIIHKDINPSNIIYNPQTQQLKIIDFGISTRLSRENPTLKNLNSLEGTLAYISPEQTGRMNRSLDYRTDFYSLGVTFYELLTGQLPFMTEDVLELVHCHIAKSPIPPHQLVGAHRRAPISKAISNIVMKLMAKTAEERYQSAWGLKADLEECLKQLRSSRQISDFPLGTQEVCDRILIPQKLYGREREVEALLQAFERVTTGQSEFLLVAGYSGIGKSSLVQEIYKPITAKRGYFISGKFDQYQRNIPYSAIIQAFKQLSQQLLTETDAQLAEWKAKILTAVGTNGRVIIDIIPEVELIIGEQPPLLDLAAAEAQKRFNFVFQDFIKVFTEPAHPLAIFLDDLQWADGASLKLIELLLTSSDAGLLLIGAYRDNEVNGAHPLRLSLENLQKEGVRIQEIFLNPLELETVNRWLADMLTASREAIHNLAELVQGKTGGNPFFTTEFLQALYPENLLNFDYEQKRWIWEIKQVQNRNFTDNVVELMVAKIQKVPSNTQEVLKLAACIGNQFELETLAVIWETSERETALTLQEAVAEGLIQPLGDEYKTVLLEALENKPLAKVELTPLNPPETGGRNLTPSPLRGGLGRGSLYFGNRCDEKNQAGKLKVEYQFSHDRIQQAAYSLIPDELKQRVHLQIGQLLLQNTPESQIEEKIFDIVNQLNHGSELVKNQQQRDKIANLNLIAGQKAKSSTAYQPALMYLQQGLEWLGKDRWQRQYETALALYVEAAEAAYLCGQFEEMDGLVAAVLQNAKRVLDQVKVYEVKIQASIAQQKLREAIDTGLTILKLLGVKLPKNPTKLNVISGFVRTKLMLAGKPIENLIDLPEMTSLDKEAAMQILNSIVSAAYRVAPNLMSLLIFKGVNLSIKYGNTFSSPVIYALYGPILGRFIGDIESGYRFGNLALGMLEKHKSRNVKIRTVMLVNNLIRHWREHPRQALQNLLDGYSIGLETLELEDAGYCAITYCYYSYYIGKELTLLESEIAKYSEVFQKFKHEQTFYLIDLVWQSILNLIDTSRNSSCLFGKIYNESKKLQLYIEANDRHLIFNFYSFKTMLCYCFGQEQEALKNAALAERYIDAAVGTPNVPIFYFYDSLASINAYSSSPKSQQKHLYQKVQSNQKKMKKWAHYAPMNYLHKFYLVEAERYRILGQIQKAMDCYEHAIALAKENEYIQEEALAYELAAKFYLSQGKELIARTYLQEAHYRYLRWGAIAKVKDLETRYPKLLQKPETALRASVNSTTSVTSTSGNQSSETLDLATVIKASQAISGEIILEQLLMKLMKIILENAGAQTGYLILEQGGKFAIEASGTVETDSITVLQSLPLETRVPISIVNYVARSRESVICNNALVEGKFTTDSYIQQHQPKSILCTPLVNQGKLISLVYLENNLTVGAFTPQRIEIVNVLASQAAISIENAKLYTEVRQNESRLTQFLEAMPVGVGILEASGKIYYTNRLAQELLGKGVVPNATSEQIAEVYQLYQAGTKQEYPSADLPGVRALSGESATADDMEIHKGDKIIPIEAWGMPIYDEKGNISYSISAFQDITERKKAEAERERFTTQLLQLNQAFERFVPSEFLRFLNKQSIVDVQLGDQVEQEMSVLFSDIRDFTTLSEQMNPEENFRFINSYLSRISPVIREHQGFIDKYIGDAIMALFSGGADNAVKAGIAMLNKLVEYNEHRMASGYKPIQIGIGINTGLLMLGTVGEPNRMDGTVISDTVNLASRTEGLTKNYGVSLLITHETFKRLRNPRDYAIRRIDEVKVKGKSEYVTIYEVFDADPPELKAAKLAMLKNPDE
jgi:PAS domain S-box-containing protein